jgi:transposase-like protein
MDIFARQSEAAPSIQRAIQGQVLAACAEPGAVVAAVAFSLGLNANLVRQWQRGRGYKGAAVLTLKPAGDCLRPRRSPSRAAGLEERDFAFDPGQCAVDRYPGVNTPRDSSISPSAKSS